MGTPSAGDLMWARPRPATLYSVHPPNARNLRNLKDSPIPRNAPNASNQRNALFLFFGPFGGKSHAVDSFSIVPRLTFGEMRHMRQIGPTLFFGPSGGKSDAADPFSIVPKLTGETKIKCGAGPGQLSFYLI